MSGFINLGRKPEKPSLASLPKRDSKEYFPTTYISGVGDDLDLESGQGVLIEGEVISCTKTIRDGKTSYSCEIECRGLKPQDKSEESGLDKALDRISAKKQASIEDEE